MKKGHFLFLTIFLLLLQLNNPLNANDKISSSKSGYINLYTFSMDSQLQFDKPKPFVLLNTIKISDVLDTLGKHLSQTYFYEVKMYKRIKTNIKFEVLKVEEIQTPIRPFRIATINLVDPQEQCMGYFFQGSAGGYVTANMLLANFTQPHLLAPLLDGLIILYNGKVLPMMDHINLDRIFIPGDLRQRIQKAIRKK